jgi:TP901 family phage tail tape measure protein
VSDNDINLAALWVPVMAETSHIKAQLARAGTEGGAAFAAAFKSAADVQNAIGGGRSLDVLAQRWEKLKGIITGSADGAGKAMQVFNTVGVASVVGLGAAMVGTTKAAGDFQASQERLVASAGETAKGMQDVSNGILQLAGKVGYSAQQLSDAMYTVEKAGYRGAEGVNVLKAAAEGAKSENADLKEVLSGLTTTMNDFGLSADKAPDVMSKMVVATGMAKTNFQDFAGALHSVEPIAGAVGQSLDAVGKQHLLADVYGSLAQLTQSGMGAAQAGQNLGRAFTTLSSPTQKMRDELGQLGLNAEDISQHLGERGMAGSLQLISDRIRSQMNPAGQVVIDTFLKSEQASGAAKKEFDALPPAAQKVAQAIKDGTLAWSDFRKSRGGLSVEDANLVTSWNNLNNKVTGFSTALKSGQGDIQTYMQALAAATGNQETARAATLLTGEATDKTNDSINKINGTTREHDGTVKGFNETQSTLNAKMADAKAAFGAAAIEIGTAFIPVMTSVANVAKDVGDAMAKHPGITHAVVDALGLLSTAWLGVKAIGIAETILAPITRALATMAEGEGVAATAAGGLGTALSALGPIAAGVGAGMGVAALTDKIPAVHNRFAGQHDPVSDWFHQHASWIPQPGYADGGAIHGSGSVGKDSVLSWLAPGEHVLTHHDVRAMGGQANVYTFRKGLHMAGISGYVDGGAIGPDVQAAMSMAGTPYSQNARNDCSGMVGRVIEAATGMGGGLPTTQNMGEWLSARGFVSGTGGPGTISVGWYNHGSSPNDGHTAMTLSNGENAESGGSHGNFLIGGGVGASSSQFDHHMYLPNLYGEGMGGGGGGGIPAGATAGIGPGGQSGYYTPNPAKVGHAQEEVTHLQNEIKTLEERKATLKSTAGQAEKDRLEEALRHEHALLDEATGRLDKAKEGDFHKSSGGRGGSSGGDSSTESQAQQFGQNFLSGALSDLGFGNVLGGKSPLDWGIVKLATGLAGWGINMANAWADNKGKKLGLPGFGGGGSGSPGGMLTGFDSLGAGLGGLDSLAALGAGLSMGDDSALGAGLLGGDSQGGGSGGGGGGGLASAAMGLIPGAPKSPLAARGSSPADVSGWTHPAPGAGKMPVLGPGQGYVPPSSTGAQILPGFKSGAGTPWIPGMTAKFATGGPSGTDTVPAWLSPGEFVMSQPAVNKYGAKLLTAMNARKFASGGQVNSDAGSAMSTAFSAAGGLLAALGADAGAAAQAYTTPHIVGGHVALAPSAVGGVPTPAGADARAAGGGGITNDNRIIVQGNSMVDPHQLVPPMQQQMNANTYGRGGMGTDNRGGSLPATVGAGGG